jgi:ATP-dependent Clp protease ATP-binding subunit ClpA
MAPGQPGSWRARRRFNHEYIGTEHILLGLVQEGSGVAANVLKNLEVDLKKIRLEVEKLVKTGTRTWSRWASSRSRPGPRRSSSWRSRRPAISGTTTSAPSTCCSG